MDVDGCPFPDHLLFDLEHDVWLTAEPEDGRYRLGILSSLASFAGRFTSFSYRDLQGVIASGRSIGTVESVRYTGAVRLPVDAEVVERNPTLAAHPKLLNDSPYEQGWVAVIRPRDPVGPGPNLLIAREARERLLEKIRSLRIRCYPASPDLELYEIGAECSAILSRVDEELARRPPGDVLLLITDDPTSPIEMVRWTDRTGHRVLAHRTEGGLHHFLIRKEETPIPRRRGPGGAPGGA